MVRVDSFGVLHQPGRSFGCERIFREDSFGVFPRGGGPEVVGVALRGSARGSALHERFGGDTNAAESGNGTKGFEVVTSLLPTIGVHGAVREP